MCPIRAGAKGADGRTDDHGQRWVHYQLRALAATGQAIQIKRGTWRAANREGDAQ